MREKSIKAYAGEERSVFYRSRFEVRPADGLGIQVWPHVVRELQVWVEEKQYFLARYDKPDFLDVLRGDPRDYPSSGGDGVDSCVLNAAFVDGAFSVATAESRLETEALPFEEPEGAPQYWAMEYMERSNDEHRLYRRYCTNVGVTVRSDGSCVVNVGVYTIDDPSCMLGSPPLPERTVPRFIARMLGMSGCVATSGGFPFPDGPIVVDASNFDSFLSALCDPGRDVPVLAVSAERGGGFLLDPQMCATRLRGAAIVCALSLDDPYVLIAHNEAFKRDTSAYRYGVPAGFARVYLPGVHLDDQLGYIRHRFYSPSQLRDPKVAATLVNDICGSITRLSRRRRDEVVDLRGVREQCEARSRREREARIERMREELEAGERRIEEASRGDVATMGDVDAIASLRARNSALEEQVAHYRDQIDSYVELTASLKASENEARSGQGSEELKDEISLYEEDNKRLGDEVAALKKQNASLRSKATALQTGFDEMRAKVRYAEAQDEVLSALEHFPRDAAEALDMAQRAFPTRLKVLDEAYRSAEDYGSGDPEEVWDILRCMATTLWRLYFETPSCDVASEFRDACGYDISLSESSQTNKHADMRKARTRTYNGREMLMNAHVKGKSGSRTEVLRIHYDVDRDEKLIIVGHCGAHLETAGTYRVR